MTPAERAKALFALSRTRDVDVFLGVVRVGMGYTAEHARELVGTLAAPIADAIAAAVAAEREACARAVESAGRGCASVTSYEIAARAIRARGEAPKVHP